MDWTTLIGPAVIAAIVAGVISLVTSWRTTASAERLQRDKLEADAKLAERKTNAEIDLLYKRFDLETDKRRQDLAEETLSSFYQARHLISAIRSPGSHEGEGSTRQKPEGEPEVEARQRDIYYAVVERLTKHSPTFSELFSRRYRMVAWFGPEANAPFEQLSNVVARVHIAAGQLITLPVHERHADFRRRMEDLIWEDAPEDDATRALVEDAIRKMENICRPVLARRAGE